MKPTHVVIDTRDGYTFWRDSAGVLFGEDAARAFAALRNAGETAGRYEVLALVPAPAVVPRWRAADPGIHR